MAKANAGGNYRKINLKKKGYSGKNFKGKGNGKNFFKKKKKNGQNKPSGCYLCGGEGHWAKDCTNRAATRKDAFDLDNICEDDLLDAVVNDLPHKSRG